jgi:hypothetical protein
MRAGSLQTNALLPVEAAFVGYAACIGVAAFARWAGLIIHDEWLVPLMLMMGLQFLGDVLLGWRTQTLTTGGVIALLRVKIVLLLSVAAAFTIDRMRVPQQEGLEAFWRWGHITMGVVIAWELARIIKVLQAFEAPLGVLGIAVEWIETKLAMPRELLKMQQIARTAATAERQAAKEEYWDTGEIKSHPAIDTISSDGIPSSSGHMPSIDATDFADGDE